MKSNIEILSEIFEPTSFDCKTEIEDLQIAITLNPDLSKILRAMELAQEQVKLCNIPHVSGSALADLNHIVVNAAMNISTTAIENTAIQTECKKIIDTVRGFTKHYR